MRTGNLSSRAALDGRGLADGDRGRAARPCWRRGPATLSVPGGTTPGPVFDCLVAGGSGLGARCRCLLNDERWVGEDSPRSNTRLLRERLLVGAGGGGALVPLYAPHATPEEGLAAFVRRYRAASAD